MSTAAIRIFKPDLSTRGQLNRFAWLAAYACFQFAASLTDKLHNYNFPNSLTYAYVAGSQTAMTTCLFAILLAFFNRRSRRTIYSVEDGKLVCRNEREVSQIDLASVQKVVIRRWRTGKIVQLRLYPRGTGVRSYFGINDLDDLFQAIQKALPKETLVKQQTLWVNLDSPWKILAMGVAMMPVVFAGGQLFYLLLAGLLALIPA